MVPKLPLIVVNIWSILFCADGSPSCEDRGTATLCEVSLPKQPVTDIIQVKYFGVTLHQCQHKMDTFQWPLAVYCQSSWFCGFGIDFTRNFHSSIQSEFAPLREPCQLIVKTDMESCHDVIDRMYSSGVLKGANSFVCLTSI